jgi:hypothetical protein
MHCLPFFILNYFSEKDFHNHSIKEAISGTCAFSPWAESENEGDFADKLIPAMILMDIVVCALLHKAKVVISLKGYKFLYGAMKLG